MSNQIVTNESNKENIPENEEKKIPIFSVESILLIFNKINVDKLNNIFNEANLFKQESHAKSIFFLIFHQLNYLK